MFGRPSNALNWERERSQPESVYEHLEPSTTYSLVLIVCLRRRKCVLASVSGERFVALDVHKHYVVVGAVSSSQQVVLSPRRVDLDDFPGWGHQHLCSTDAVVLEATTNAWHLCDQLLPLVSSVTVAHPNL